MPTNKVTAIIPAYNEEARIGRVLDVITKYPFSEVIVVNDGSDDRTEEIILRYNVRYFKNPKKMGKGYSMDLAVSQAASDIIFFSDADIVGLTAEMISEIVRPVTTGKVEMFIGMRNRKIYFTNKILHLVPLLGGERALTKSLWNSVPAYYKKYFRIEAALNFYAKRFGRGFSFKVLSGLTQTIKEKKYGFWLGIGYRLKMYYEVVATQLRLLIIDGWIKNPKNKTAILSHTAE